MRALLSYPRSVGAAVFGELKMSIPQAKKPRLADADAPAAYDVLARGIDGNPLLRVHWLCETPDSISDSQGGGDTGAPSLRCPAPSWDALAESILRPQFVVAPASTAGL